MHGELDAFALGEHIAGLGERKYHLCDRSNRFTALALFGPPPPPEGVSSVIPIFLEFQLVRAFGPHHSTAPSSR